MTNHLTLRLSRSKLNPRTETTRFKIFAAVCALAGALLLWALAIASPAHGANEDAMGMVRTTVDHAIELLQNHQLPAAERRRRLIETVAGRFDFTDMARSSLGFHWKELTSKQQADFVQMYTSFMENAYLNKLDSYAGQKIEFRNSIPTGTDDVLVKTIITDPSGRPPIEVNYQTKRVDNDWKVYDVVIDNISITANYRNQFNRVINNQGYDALVGQMRLKQQELFASISK